MRRFAHYLKHNKTGALPHQFICFDTETETHHETPQGKPQRLKLYTAVYHRRMGKDRNDLIKWTHGYAPDGITDFIVKYTRAQTTLYVFSANIWFDLRVAKIIELLYEDGFTVKSFFSAGTRFQLIMVRGKATIKFLNIQNFWPVSVKKIGEVVGLEKLEVDFDEVSDEDLLTYCYRDCEIIYKAMLLWFDFIRANDLGVFGITVPSQAFNAYRHRFMPVKIGIHDSTDVLRLERRGYFGGRTECFFIGRRENKTLYALDINSMYPYVMQKFEYPHLLKGKRHNCPLDQVPEILERYCVVARCRVETPEPVYPKRHNLKTLFPIGRFETVLNTPSFKYAYEHGHIKEILNIAIYSKANLFAKWVDEMYSLRMSYKMQNNKVFTTLCKLLLNSLYGKFGQKSDEVLSESIANEVDYKIERIFDLDNKVWYLKIQFANYHKLIRQGTQEGYNSFPAIAAHVTDYARMHLWELIKCAGIEEVFYTDTDSLYVTRAGFDRLEPHIDEYKLGKLKLEKQSAYWHFFGCKDYIFQGKKVLKGIPKKCKRVGHRTFEYDLFPGIKTELRGGLTDDYTITRMRKTLARKYDKGIIAPDGRVSPFVVAEF